jgi:hypothetical protein
MHTKALFSAVVISALLSGCQSMQGADRGGPSAKSAPFTCNPSGRCTVSIVAPTCAADSCGASVDFDPIRLAPNYMNVMIRWDLPSGGAFGFCPALGDGIFLKRYDPDDQFDQGDAIGQPGGPGGPHTRCKQSYQLRGRHTSKNVVGYKYQIIFHDTDGNRYVIDPYIYND